MSKGIPPKYSNAENNTTIRVLNQKCNRDFKISYEYSRLHDLSKKSVPKEKLLRAGDVLINSTGAGTAGRVAQLFEVPCLTTIDGHMILLRPTSEIEAYYYGYAIKSFQKQIELLAEGSTGQTEINRKRLCDEIEITFPIDLNLQRQISSIFFAIDEKISTNTKINENLEQQAQAIFKSWFVDFEPFGGVMPDDWRLGTFSDIIESTLGGDWGKETSTGNYTERVYCIRGADIPEVKAGNKGKMPTRYILPKNFKNKKLIANDIVVEISGGSPTQSTGRVAAISQSLLDRYDCGMVCTNFCRAIKPCEGYSYYTYYYWQYLYDRNVFFSYENGTTGIKNLDLSGFVETESIIIPSIKAIQEFNSLIDSFHSRVFKNGQENENIAALRDTLLPKLMNGEIDVSNVRI